ncbi:hypothetical protein QUA27_21320 [Microcoleus sp. Pol14C6]|uniref:hypothetical protein n=1 Tax=unclassified Microcoleus TaxID=2642155 RepID=UPI002FD377A8
MGCELVKILYQTQIVADYSFAIPLGRVFVAGEWILGSHFADICGHFRDCRLISPAAIVAIDDNWHNVES